jgi:hypothetical protein
MSSAFQINVEQRPQDLVNRGGVRFLNDDFRQRDSVSIKCLSAPIHLSVSQEVTINSNKSQEREEGPSTLNP